MSKLIPDWIVAVIGAMYRFVVGAFGISLPHPLHITLCGPFWVAILGCTLGLPIVLFGWTVRLIFGKGRAERMWNVLDDWGHSTTGKSLGDLLLALLLIATAGGLLFIIGVSVYKYGWLNTVLVSILVVGGAALLVGLMMGASVLSSRLDIRPPKPPKEKSLWRLLGKTFTVVTWLPRMIVIGIWQILAFFGLLIVAFYKKFCPIVEFP